MKKTFFKSISKGKLIKHQAGIPFIQKDIVSSKFRKCCKDI